jgi:ubiquinone/menaquinone biosynthesis C-methylase UbiE
MWDRQRYTRFIKRGHLVLEVGCHKGLFSGAVTDRGAFYIGVDICTYGAKIDTICDGCKLPFRDNTFHVVWSSHVMEHLTNPYDYMVECHRVLKPNGITINQVGLDWRDPTHLYWLDEHCMRRLAQRAGLRVVLTHRNAPNIVTVVAQK